MIIWREKKIFIESCTVLDKLLSTLIPRENAKVDIATYILVNELLELNILGPLGTVPFYHVLTFIFNQCDKNEMNLLIIVSNNNKKLLYSHFYSEPNQNSLRNIWKYSMFVMIHIAQLCHYEGSSLKKIFSKVIFSSHDQWHLLSNYCGNTSSFFWNSK